MFHQAGLLAVERLVLQRELTTRAMFLLQAMAARMDISTGRVWTTGSELAAEHKGIPGCINSSIRRLRRVGLVVRCTAPPLHQLSERERASMPDPATRARHLARMYFLLHPGLASTGGRTRRERVLDQFHAAAGERVLRFEEELQAIEAQAMDRELVRLAAAAEAWQAKSRRVGELQHQLENGLAQGGTPDPLQGALDQLERPPLLGLPDAA